MSSALHFGTHNGAESYRGIVWHTDHHRRKILDIMSGFVGAPRRCPPEAVSGPDGFMDFPEAILDPARWAMLDWCGGPFDPIGSDDARVRFSMEKMARRRRGPPASHRSGSRRRKR